jgi:hypothetical protein
MNYLACGIIVTSADARQGKEKESVVYTGNCFVSSSGIGRQLQNLVASKFIAMPLLSRGEGGKGKGEGGGGGGGEGGWRGG